MVKILVAGDYAPRARVEQLIEQGKYSEVFSDVVPYTSGVDYAILNLEAPIVEKKGVQGIDKCGPHLSCTSKAIEAMKYAGFNMATLANNHLNDYGALGVVNTLEVCSRENIDTVGADKNLLEASKTFIKEIKGKSFAFINCCEHEFSIATEDTPGANPLNPIRQFRAITEAKKIADYVIVIVHGGHEHYQFPSPRMKEMYRFFVDAGANVVINHHQHCFSGYEQYGESFIFYGLGNFCFDIIPNRVNTSWNYGYMVELCFDTNITYNIIPYSQCSETSNVMVLAKDFLKTEIDKINSIIRDDELLRCKIGEYYTTTRNWELSILEPYSGRISRKLFSLGLLPSFIKGKKVSQILNHVECESHRDKLIFALKNMLK